MALFTDSEGAKLPKDEMGNDYFNATLCGSGDDGAMEILMNVPLFEEYGDDQDSGGVMYLRLEHILEEYLNGFVTIDGGKNAPSLIEYLRDFSNRLDARLKKTNL